MTMIFTSVNKLKTFHPLDALAEVMDIEHIKNLCIISMKCDVSITSSPHTRTMGFDTDSLSTLKTVKM